MDSSSAGVVAPLTVSSGVVAGGAWNKAASSSLVGHSAGLSGESRGKLLVLVGNLGCVWLRWRMQRRLACFRMRARTASMLRWGLRVVYDELLDVGRGDDFSDVARVDARALSTPSDGLLVSRGSPMLSFCTGGLGAGLGFSKVSSCAFKSRFSAATRPLRTLPGCLNGPPGGDWSIRAGVTCSRSELRLRAWREKFGIPLRRTAREAGLRASCSYT